MPALNWRFLRDSPNYRVFAAEDPDGGEDFFMWIPANVLTNVNSFSGFFQRGGRVRFRGVYEDGEVIHSPAPVRRRCCHRDNDGDGNCHIHSSPGVLRAGVQPQSRFEVNELCPRPFSYRNFYSPESQRDRLIELAGRVNVIEERQSILFLAVEKIIKFLEPTRALMKRVFK